MTLSLNKPKLDNLTNEIWKSAERLRGKFKAYEYQNVILPIIVIRRLECVLIKWREEKAAEVLAKRPKLTEKELAKLVKELELNPKQSPLSDQELLAILLGKGTSKMDVMTLAGKLARIIDEKGLKLVPEDLMDFVGMGDAKATLILAAIEFARRRIKPEGAKIETPADLLPHVRHYADRKQEHFLCASINGANEILNVRVISIGLIDRSPVHPREVFADALSDRASAIIVAHNHPTGGLEPSPSDIEITAQLKAAGAVVGITLLDHIIFNRSGYFSFLEAGRL